MTGLYSWPGAGAAVAGMRAVVLGAQGVECRRRGWESERTATARESGLLSLDWELGIVILEVGMLLLVVGVEGTFPVDGGSVVIGGLGVGEDRRHWGVGVLALLGDRCCRGVD